LQAKLLRVLENGEYQRVGETQSRVSNARVVAATNRDIEGDSRAGKFRSDLYFRLAVILLRLPPLRERGEDVLLLADLYLRKLSAKYGKDVRRLSPDAKALLLAYPWPGNVRELSHVIERAVLWSRGPELSPDHLSLTQPGGSAPRRTASAKSRTTSRTVGTAAATGNASIAVPLTRAAVPRT